MILLITSEYDLSSDYLEDCLIALNANYKRIHITTLINRFNQIDFNDTSKILFDEFELDINSIKVIWYRGIRASMYYQHRIGELEYDFNLHKLLTSLSEEVRNILDYFQFLLQNAVWLNKPSKVKVNKLIQMNVAQKCGLLIPDSILTTRGNILNTFKEKNKEIITKSTDRVLMLKDEGSHNYYSYTYLMKEENIKDISEDFFPSFFQKKIDKEFEIRVFYLDGMMYSMAIFSQNDKQTEVDFRRYNNIKPNRNIPYKLDNKTKDSVKKLMKTLDIRTGSLDFIKTKDNQLIFLEVNPNGQYDMVDKPCNYGLDTIIAKHLIQLDNAQ
jgi:ATP-GRASP peptide maturase of grasp-with-spasm system